VADSYFKIFKVTAEDAAELALAPNEPHVHEFEELLIGNEGQIEHFIDFKAVSFKAPFVSFITMGKVHRIKPMTLNNKCNIWVICFSSDFIPESTYQLYSYYHDHANIEFKDDNSFRRMIMLAEMINEEMQGTNPKLAVVRDILKTLFTMIEAEEEKNILQEIPNPRVQNTTFKNFLKILEENFRRPEGVGFYSDKLFMSSRNLNLICQNILHKSVSEIIETMKLIEAKNLLTYTDKTVSEIGFDLGYNEKTYFTSVFKKVTGTTPTAFREEMRRLIS
jgi:AraC family transcriptional regulator, transcriptional activator of pobA